MVWRETRNRTASIVAAGLFVCSTALAETSLDLARVDALGLFFILASLDCARAADIRAPRFAAGFEFASGVLVALAILTKQTALSVAVVLALHALLTRRLTVLGSTLRSRSVAQKAKLVADFTQKALPRFRTGELRPVVARSNPLGQAREAHAALERNEVVGKITLLV